MKVQLLFVLFWHRPHQRENKTKQKRRGGGLQILAKTLQKKSIAMAYMYDTSMSCVSCSNCKITHTAVGPRLPASRSGSIAVAYMYDMSYASWSKCEITHSAVGLRLPGSRSGWDHVADQITAVESLNDQRPTRALFRQDDKSRPGNCRESEGAGADAVCEVRDRAESTRAHGAGSKRTVNCRAHSDGLHTTTGTIIIQWC